MLPSALAFLDILDISGWRRLVVAQLIQELYSDGKKDAEMTQVRTSVVHRCFCFKCFLLIKSMFTAPIVSKFFFF